MDINKIVKEIINNIDRFIDNTTMPKDQIASYIVGATMMRDDYDDIIAIAPEIEELAEMASDFEVTSPNNIYINQYYEDMLKTIEKIKYKYDTK